MTPIAGSLCSAGNTRFSVCAVGYYHSGVDRVADSYAAAVVQIHTIFHQVLIKVTRTGQSATGIGAIKYFGFGLGGNRTCIQVIPTDDDGALLSWFSPPS
jgi:hypothetical protein